MAQFSLIRPLDQPLGTRRLLQELKTSLQDPRLTDFCVIVAYAKSGPLLRLRSLLEAWRVSGKTSTAIFGLDQRGTSKEALEIALHLFDSVYVTRHVGITFHPKIYIFKGHRYARAFIGSNNLTVGGTEKNFESAVHIDLSLPRDSQLLATVESTWRDLLPAVCPATDRLTGQLIKKLVLDGIVVEERAMRSGVNDNDAAHVGRKSTVHTSALVVKPESPLPKSVFGGAGPSSPTPVAVRGFAIQIIPHHNGEIFLSKTAINQNPSFFGWPFTGNTTPKIPSNPSYPQRTPDPVVNITVWGNDPHPKLTMSNYNLNMVYYARKSEIRVTAAPLVSIVPRLSIMIIEHSDATGVDYDITIYRPDNIEYQQWVSICDQSMPGGGNQARRFGWF